MATGYCWPVRHDLRTPESEPGSLHPCQADGTGRVYLDTFRSEFERPFEGDPATGASSTETSFASTTILTPSSLNVMSTIQMALLYFAQPATKRRPRRD